MQHCVNKQVALDILKDCSAFTVWVSQAVHEEEPHGEKSVCYTDTTVGSK
jgi:hypothetical protein